MKPEFLVRFHDQLRLQGRKFRGPPIERRPGVRSPRACGGAARKPQVDFEVTRLGIVQGRE